MNAVFTHTHKVYLFRKETATIIEFAVKYLFRNTFAENKHFAELAIDDDGNFLLLKKKKNQL